VSAAATPHSLFATRPRSGVLVDVAIAAAAFAGTMALLSRHGVGSLQRGAGELDWVSGVLAACSTLPLVAWRRAPGAVFVLTASASVLMGGLGYSIGLLLGPTAALYLLAASRDEDDPWTRGTTATAVTLFVAYLAATAVGEGVFPGSELLHTGLAWAVAWFAGERTRLMHEHLAELHERARRADREADRERRLALAEERARIARDLHDSAGQAINVIAVRAGAARLRHDEDPERSRRALAAIEEVARDTVADIDRIVVSLRDGRPTTGDVEAPHGLASLGTLVARHKAAGLELAVRTRGVSRPLPGAVDQAAYRILQEALSNAARHGTGAASIEVGFGDRRLQLTITNPVHPHAAAPRSSGGHGLVGMGERASLLGGELDAGRVDGAFRVRAELPYAGRRQ
jgi:signal transduction histidine kinase